MSESRNHGQPLPQPRRAAPAVGCFGITTGEDLYEAERRVAAQHDRPSLDEFEGHYAESEAAPKRRRKFESAH